ncbi:MAG: extracellular solute-binding protein, partial [Clostridiaceae bacterium]
MGKKRIVKLIALTMVVFTLFAAAAGCGNSQQEAESKTTDGQANVSTAVTASPSPTATANPADAASIAKYGIGNINAGKTVEEILSAGDFIIPADNVKFPISQTPITLKAFRVFKNLDVELSEMPVLKDYEKKTNIHIEWTTPPNAAYKDKFNLMMNSGDLPDIIIGFPGDQLEQVEMYGNQGALIDLSKLIDKSAPNVKELFTQTPAIKKMVTTDDGKIYSLPYIMGDTPGNNVLMARQDWLTKLNLQPPTTTEEWYTVLKAFKTMGPDVWPFSSYGTNGKSIDNVINLITAWGLYTGGSNNEFYIADSETKVYPKDNKIHYGPIESRFKEGLEWVIKLYKEGLIDPESVTNDSKAFQAKVLNDKVGAWRGQTNGDMQVLNDTATKNGKSEDQFHVVEMPIMKGPYGDQIHFWADDYKGAAGQQGAFC